MFPLQKPASLKRLRGFLCKHPCCPSRWIRKESMEYHSGNVHIKNHDTIDIKSQPHAITEVQGRGGLPSQNQGERREKRVDRSYTWMPTKSGHSSSTFLKSCFNFIPKQSSHVIQVSIRQLLACIMLVHMQHIACSPMTASNKQAACLLLKAPIQALSFHDHAPTTRPAHSLCYNTPLLTLGQRAIVGRNL